MPAAVVTPPEEIAPVYPASAYSTPAPVSANQAVDVPASIVPVAKTMDVVAIPAELLQYARHDLPLHVQRESVPNSDSRNDSLHELSPFIFAPDFFVPPPMPQAPVAARPSADEMIPPPKSIERPPFETEVLSTQDIRSMFNQQAAATPTEEWRPRRLPKIIALAAVLLLSVVGGFYLAEQFIKPVSGAHKTAVTSSSTTTTPTEAASASSPANTMTTKAPSAAASALPRPRTLNQTGNQAARQPVTPDPPRQVAEVETNLHARAVIPHDDGAAKQPDAPAPIAATLAALGAANSRERSAIAAASNTAAPTVRMNPVVPLGPNGTLKVSSGVMSGAKLGGPDPQYPAWARTAHIAGDVVLSAVISKNGTVKDLSVISGPVGLRDSALYAVSRWRYRPYLLDGQPTDVQTSIIVRFNFGHPY
jgi:protein TonB